MSFRKYILCVFISIIFFNANSVKAQTVTFLHGLGDEHTYPWRNAINDFQSLLSFNDYQPQYNSGQSITTTANNIYIPYNSIVVAHSQGGIVARDFLQQSEGKVKALITVGTPHNGAFIAKRTLEDDGLKILTQYWINQLAQGPASELGQYYGRLYAEIYMQALGFTAGGALQAGLLDMFNDVPSVKQMYPGSTFMNQLNSSANHNLPNNNYAIYGAEYFYDYVRLGESFYNRNKGWNRVERGKAIQIHSDLRSFYYFMYIRYDNAADMYYRAYRNASPYDSNILEYYEKYLEATRKARAWGQGFFSLHLLQQYDWDHYMLNMNWYVTSDGKIMRFASDGFVSPHSQAPNYFQHILYAIGANHVEEPEHPSVKRNVSNSLRNEGITFQLDLPGH